MGNYNFDDLQYLQIPLPEELLKLKWHGSFTRMKRIIDAKLANDIPIALKKRLLHEKEIIRSNHDESPHNTDHKPAHSSPCTQVDCIKDYPNS